MQGRKITSGKYHQLRKKRAFERQKQEREVVLGETKIKSIRVRGNNQKTFLLKSNVANVLVESKAQKTQITNVIETPQNKFWARQNRIVKGAIIETPLGKARITNRPTQEGNINAVLIK